ncbi:MAG: hypothetical protein HQ508_00720 [Candidatus Marinimicrobia bacterium]|nr:hypothetical protein [Candidatus Neomarinimicrobiota bacterium]
MYINRELVVVSLPRANHLCSEYYLFEEGQATRNKAGMWGGDCEAPWDWRSTGNK